MRKLRFSCIGMATIGVGVSALLASAFSSTLGTRVVTTEQYRTELARREERGYVEYKPLQIEDLWRICHAPAPRQYFQSPLESYKIGVRDLNGVTHKLSVTNRYTVDNVKCMIETQCGIPSQQQNLVCAGHTLRNDQMLGQCNAGPNGTLHLLTGQFYIDDSLLDPTYDYDFTQVKDEQLKFYRGERPYYRPCGWMRYGLNVKGRYEDDVWLGEPGYRTISSPGEWPVSYHGTQAASAGGITSEGYDVGKGKRAKFGEGIYSTPLIEVAAMYAVPFTHEWRKYKLVFQNRVSEVGLSVIPASETGVNAEYLIQPNDRLIRPYGICIREYS